MGYKRPGKTYRLTFEDEPELEVLAKSVPVGELLDVMELADRMTGAPKKKDVRTLFGWFIRRVISWNLEEEDGTPIPAVLARCTGSGLDVPEPGRCAEHAENEGTCPVTGLLAQDFDFALRLVLAWVQAVSSVAAPLVTTSTATTPTATNPMEATIPMASPAGT